MKKISGVENEVMNVKLIALFEVGGSEMLNPQRTEHGNLWAQFRHRG